MQLGYALPQQDKEACTHKHNFVEILEDFIEANKKKKVQLKI